MQKKLSLKIIVIFIIGALLLIPLFMISDKIAERQRFLDSAKYSVSQNWIGPQRIATPILVIPYVSYSTDQRVNKQPVNADASSNIETQASTKVALILAHQLSIDANLATSIRYKGIYQVPIYNANVNITGEFDQ
jgi:inner membrane protein